MKPKKTVGPASRPVVGGAAQPTGIPPMWALVTVLVALTTVFWAYAPAMHGGFLFDDTFQQFALPAASSPLASWIGPVRPVLMFSYWINSQISGQDTYSFHVFNVLFHCFTTFLIFAIDRRLVGGSPACPTRPATSWPPSPPLSSFSTRLKPNPSRILPAVPNPLALSSPPPLTQSSYTVPGPPYPG